MQVDQVLPEPDPSFDLVADAVRDIVRAPVAFITIVQSHRQVFPGAAGLPEPWQQRRQTPLSHSFCKYVVRDDAPVIVADARLDERLRDNLAIPELHVIAYAGYPLRDVDGAVIGSVCAVDTQPRVWTHTELRLLEEFAHECSTQWAKRVRATDDAPASGDDPSTIELVCDPSVIRVARVWCREQLLESGIGDDELSADAQLIVSELVTNAVRAGCERLTLTVRATSGRLHLAARDTAPGRPELRHASAHDSSGRGLAIVAVLATDWGVLELANGKEVWAQLPVPSL